ncbi:metallopeptidase TldD-related protein [Asanoa sp. WMMD1127]|uniref:TldD/PmbA family protein n=1 Tax=Asanoa sp. WMMD1127 TaxID=3016107 RepID=UPI002416B2C2|nr:metallopeptidase TldD-related protein [Asanoa sp. WMMD1127]MDG4822896.1 metallopeptidase TldD-related protein [Asanoa sp. WMMD1127]
MSAELELAGRVVDLVQRLAGSAAQAEVLVDHTTLALTRFANSGIHQNVADATTTVRLRVHLDGRTVGGSTTVVDATGLTGLVERTIAAAALTPVDPGWPGLAPAAPLPADGAWDEATAQATPADRAQRVRAFVDAAEGLETAGYCRTLLWSGAFGNSAGQAVHGRATEVAMDGIARVPGADGVARLGSRRLADVDGAVLGERAARKARAGADPIELPPGRYEVVLEPTAVADLLANFAMYGFNGKLHNERRSFAELGAAQFDPAVTISDDVTMTAGAGIPFDGEGTPKRAVTFVGDGITLGVAHDRRTAAEGHAVSTGHSWGGSSSWGPVPTNLRLVPDDAAPTAAVAGPAADGHTAALLSTMERGLLVTDFWYTRVLDPKTLVVTGLTRNGVWLVENGEITRPVRNFRFTQSYPLALGPGAVLGVGGNAITPADSWDVFGFTGPSLRLASWNFTGGASG